MITGGEYHGEDPGTDTVPDMMSECPVCLEQLFDEEGVARNGQVAKIMCFHLVHDNCLREAAYSLNSDGQRFGISGLDLGPRAGCPICNRPVSFWSKYENAAAFPIFWMKCVLDILEEIGPNEGPIPVNRVTNILQADDTLTKEQKQLLKRGHGPFDGALQNGSKCVMWEAVDGGMWNGGSEKMYCKKMAWHWNESDDTVWLYKWGR